MKAERIGGAMHRAINRFLDRIPHRVGVRNRGVWIEDGRVRVRWRSFAKTHPQFSRLMRLNRRLHGDWR